jgi:RNase P subunit RPR2
VHGTNKKKPAAIRADGKSNERHASRPNSKGAAGSNARFEFTRFTKSDGPLTKRISLSADDSIKSDGGACLMACGHARRLRVSNVKQLAAVIERICSNQAIGLGALRPDLPDEVEVVTKAKLVNGTIRPDLIARTGANILFRKGQPAFALLDFDTKGMPPGVADELKRLGGFWEALRSVLPKLGSVATVTRRSTSAGLLRSDTGESLPGSDGLHVYLPVQDGADIPRFSKALHERCWLADLGFMKVGRAGQLLERSPIDYMVGRPERLVFEGEPVLEPPLEQDRKSRRPVVLDGDTLDTVTACPSLSNVESARLDEMRAREKQRLRPEAARARAAYIEGQASRIAKRKGVSMPSARRIIARQCDGILLPDAAARSPARTSNGHAPQNST